ncbi:hypothetical protein [uncultured Flavobacterium sp.]|uniref:hypothetical protein n=1 Tax=uncultured Flavobacterium sp. TaxID=165435 RepID=UPI0025DE8B05|nr:hypothetical protein [uncultured Flavobacterium sp.]
MHNIQTEIHNIKPELPITMIQLPDGHSMNDMWVNYGSEGITEFLKNVPEKEDSCTALTVNDNDQIEFSGKAGTYKIMGNLPNDRASMKIALQIIANGNTKRHRIQIDLFEIRNVETHCQELSDKYSFDPDLLESDLSKLADLLDDYRDKLLNEEANSGFEQNSKNELTPNAHEKAVEFLRKPNLMANIDKLLEQSGIIGEENNRKILFVAASSYKMSNPLHVMVQASSGSGKSHLINSIAGCMPQHEVFNTTSLTSKSLYYCTDRQLNNKLLVIQDFDGLDEEAELALREIQSFKQLKRTTVEKTASKNRKTVNKTVKASLASLIATTKTEIYQDNESRTIVLGIDESEEQTLKIIKQQNQRKAGNINSEKELDARQKLSNCMKVLKNYDVVNPYADKIDLPLDARMLRRLNGQFQDFICQITILHQYQRQTDSQKRLISTKEDVQLAVEIFFDAIIMKVDDLSGNIRQFFEKLKDYCKKQPAGTTYKFTQREIRQEIKLSATPINKYFKALQEMEYIQIAEGSPNKGYKYKISYWDTMEKKKAEIKNNLNNQLKQL